MMSWQGISVKNYFDGWARRYEGSLSQFGYSVPEEIARVISGRDILDLGIGTGLCARAYKDRFAGARICGVDISGRMLGICQKSGVADELLQLDLQTAPLPYPDARFDSVICGGVSEFMARPEFMLAEGARVLKPGGVFAIAFEGAEGAKLYRYVRRRAHYMRVLRFGLWPRPNFYRKYLYSVQAVVDMCEGAGLCARDKTYFTAYTRKGGEAVGHWLLVCKKPAHSF